MENPYLNDSVRHLGGKQFTVQLSDTESTTAEHLMQQIETVDGKIRQQTNSLEARNFCLYSLKRTLIDILSFMVVMVLF